MLQKRRSVFLLTVLAVVVVLAFAMFAVACTPASDQDDTSTEDDTWVKNDGLTYKKNDDGTYTIIGYVGTDNHLVIGKTHMGAEVTGIGENAFGETVVEITIPNEINPNTSQYVSNILTVGIDAFIKTEWYRNMSGDFVIYDNLLLAYKGNAKVVIVPESVSVIAEGLFKNNKSIEL